ncbi:MAG TPA: TRAP transporter small permease, partial [Burkholderiales bacterium]
DEAAVFLLVGATFFAGAHVQAHRGHVGIEALATILPQGVNRVRMLLVDLLTLAFCAFFSWKSWTLFHEAWAEGHTTTSTWGPPLWIPYSTMALGMTVLTIQVLLQFTIELQKRSKPGPEEHAGWLGD